MFTILHPTTDARKGRTDSQPAVDPHLARRMSGSVHLGTLVREVPPVLAATFGEEGEGG